jgi:hypothetical protein
MAPSFRFRKFHAAAIRQLTEGKLQEALQHVTTQVNGAFKSLAVAKASSILPSLIGSLPETVGRNANVTALS